MKIHNHSSSNKIGIIPVISLGMYSVFLLFHLFAFSYPIQDPDDFLERHFEVVGQEMWNQLPDVTIEGRIVDKDYRGHPMKLLFKPPRKIYLEGTYQDRRFTEGFDGTVAWRKYPGATPYQITGLEALLLQNYFSMGSPLYLLRDQVKFNGLMDLEGTLYLTWILENDEIRRIFFIDREDYHLYYEQFHAIEDERIVTKVYEKYQNYQGLAIPTAVRFEGPAGEKELIYDDVLIGLGVKDRQFAMPESQ